MDKRCKYVILKECLYFCFIIKEGDGILYIYIYIYEYFSFLKFVISLVDLIIFY